MAMNVDYLIIGTGISGLSYAIKLAEHFKQKKKEVSICLLCKDQIDESATKYAQGGVASVLNNNTDSYQNHISDTLKCGDGLCTQEIVEMVVTEGPDRIREIIGWGAQFTKTKTGEYDLVKEGGHSHKRFLHYKDITGREIIRALLLKVSEYPSIKILPHFFSTDIITEHHLGNKISRNHSINCFGVYALEISTEKMHTILANTILLATGGASSIYQTTTNPLLSTGDGVAMAYRARAEICNMEFFQFHPTSLYDPGQRPSFLISEAVRGFGGILKTKDELEFMSKYDSRASLASRDVVARAIDAELKKSGDQFVYLDVSHTNIKDFKQNFPNIDQKCLSIGIDVATQMIPVVPAAHYMCGGIKVDKTGKTSINNLYACGECSYTGLHGANRLASNSLLEALVFSHRTYLDTTSRLKKSLKINVPDWTMEGTTHPKELSIICQAKKELQEIMSNYVGIVRSNHRLNKAQRRIKLLHEEMVQTFDGMRPSKEILELRNMINVAHLIVEQALSRQKNVGLHYSIDL